MSKVEVEVKDPILSPLDKIRVYPLTAIFPLNARISLKDIIMNKIYGKVTGVDLIEATIGSLVLARDIGGLWRQIPFVVPNASTISEVLSVSRRGSRFDLASVPSRISLDAGLVYISFDLTRAYEKLWKCLAIRFSKNISDKFIININKNNRIECIIIKEGVEKLLYDGSLTCSDMIIDPKAIVKATVYPHISTWSVRIINLRQGYHNTLSFVQPIDYLMMDLKIKPEIIKSTVQEIVTHEHVSLKFLRLRTRALSRFNDILFEELGPNVDPFSTILRAYCRFIVERSQNYIKRASQTGSISLDVISYSQALAYALIEMGLHGISHAMMRYLAAKLKLDVSRLRELIIVAVNVPSHVDNPDRALNTYLGIIDGYIFRVQLSRSLLRDASAYSMFGVVGIILPRPYSRKLIEAIFLQDKKESNIHKDIINYINMMTNSRGINGCYNVWLSNKGIAEATFNRTINFLSGTRICTSTSSQLSLANLLDAIKNETETKFRILNIGSPDDLAKILYISRVDYRRILVRTILRRIIERELKRVGIKDTRIHDQCYRRALNNIKPYVPIIYETSVPYCFDGCYNCVLLKDCGSKHPIIREWIVSKWAMKYLLGFS